MERFEAKLQGLQLSADLRFGRASFGRIPIADPCVDAIEKIEALFQLRWGEKGGARLKMRNEILQFFDQDRPD